MEEQHLLMSKDIVTAESSVEDHCSSYTLLHLKLKDNFSSLK